MSDWLLYTIVFGGILVLNLLSLLFVYLFRKDAIPQNKGSKAFFIIWMIICGFTYWIAVGVSELATLIHRS